MHLRLWTDLFATLVGFLEALLLARLVAQLFAVRQDQDVLRYVVMLTAPLIQPLKGLDQGQPLFGARLEFSTLLLCFLIPVLCFVGQGIVRRYRSM